MSEDIREGEIATTLPEKFDAGVYFIGRIRTPWTRRDECPRNARGSDAVCTIELDPRYVDVTISRWQNVTGRTAVKADKPTACLDHGSPPVRAASPTTDAERRSDNGAIS